MRRVALSLAAAALVAASPAGAACLSPPEAESLALVAMPEIIRETGLVCVDQLPPDSLVRQTRGSFIAKYDDAAARAWPDAREAIVRLSDPVVSPLLQSEYARPLLVRLLVPQLVGRINPADCSFIDRFVTSLAPLPPRNAAGVVVTALQYLKEQKARGKASDAPDLPLCREPAR